MDIMNILCTFHMFMYGYGTILGIYEHGLTGVSLQIKIKLA